MDPFSIVTGAVGIAGFAASLTHSLAVSIEQTKTVYSNLRILSSELQSLETLLKSVETSLKTPKLKEALQQTVPSEDLENHLSAINDLLRDCELALKSLENILKDTQSSRLARGVLKKPATAWKFNTKSQELGRIQNQLHTYNNTMQVYLQILNLLVSADSASTIQHVDSKLSDIEAAILRIRFSEQPESLDSESTAVDNEEKPARRVKDYLDSAEDMLTSASQYFGSVAGSIRGDMSVADFSTEKADRIGGWMNKDVIDEDDGSDSTDEDDEKSYISEFGIIATEKFAKKDYSGAREFYLKFVQKALEQITWDHGELFEAQLKLASCYSVEHDYESAEQTLKFIDGAQCTAEQQLQVQLHLAELAVLRSDLHTAKREVQPVITRRRKLFGKKSHQYYDSVSLMVDILQRMDDKVEAEVFARQVPSNYKATRILGWPDGTPGGAVNGLEDGLETPQEKVAVNPNDQSILIELADAGFSDISTTEPEKDSKERALLWACGNNRRMIVKWLIDRGAKVNERLGLERAFSLSIAVTRNRPGIVKMLLEAGAYVNLRIQWDVTPLHLASREGNVQILRALLEHEADIDAHDADGMTALMIASDKGHDRIVALLIEHGADIDLRNNGGRTALSLASSNGSISIIKNLLKADADVLKQDNARMTALMHASKGGHEPAVELLIDNGAAVEAADVNCHTALYFAIQEGHKSTVRSLIEYGADVNAKTSNEGTSPLMSACQTGSVELTELLLAEGAQIHARSSNGTTALMAALTGGNVQVMRMLVEKGLDKDARNDIGETAVFHSCHAYYHKRYLTTLLELGASANIANKSGSTPLHVAVYWDQQDKATMLVNANANVNAQNEEELTPLMSAVWHTKKKMVQFLLENGANVHVATTSGQKAIDMTQDADVIGLLQAQNQGPS